jgi:hypothetical protein
MIRAFPLFSLLPLVAMMSGTGHAASDTSEGEPPSVEAVVEMIGEYCGSCHGVPPPGLMPRRSWPKVIQAMADLSEERLGQQFIPPDAVRHITA